MSRGSVAQVVPTLNEGSIGPLGQSYWPGLATFEVLGTHAQLHFANFADVPIYEAAQRFFLC